MDIIKQQEEEIKQLKSRLEKSVEVFKSQQKIIDDLTNEINELKKQDVPVQEEPVKDKTEPTSKNIFNPVKATFTI